MSKKRNDMKDKIFEVAKNHTENEETAMQLTNELCVLLGVSGSSFKNDMSKAFVAGRQLEKKNKLTDWDEEQEKDIEHSGFNGWFNYHYR